MPDLAAVRVRAPHARARRARVALLLVLALAAAPLAAQAGPVAVPGDKTANLALNIGALGSQKVVVLPVGAVLLGEGAVADTAEARKWRDPVQGPAAVDAAFAQALSVRAPEVAWILPDETRRMVRRAAGLLPPAERLGQAMLLRNGSKTLPDPLRANLRTLSAMGGGRYALVPGGVIFRADSAGTVRAALTLVVGDPRTGEVLFRTNAYGRGASAMQALAAAFDATLPPEPSLP